jgi:hypothetical protein
MNSSLPNPHVLYSVKTAAWLLGMPPSEVHRAVRTGALLSVPRGGRRLIPAYALGRLLGEPHPTSRDREGGCA